MTVEKKHEVQLEVCYQELEEGKMSDWEVNFIESLSDQITNKHFISEKQEEILQKIYDKVV